MTNPVAAQGTIVKLGNGASSEVFTEIVDVFDGPDGLGFTLEMLEKRVHSQTAKIKKPSAVDSGAPGFSILYDSTNTQHLALETSAKNKTRKNFEVIFPDAGAAKYAFSAYVSFVMTAPVEDFLSARVTLTIDGAITVT